MWSSAKAREDLADRAFCLVIRFILFLSFFRYFPSFKQTITILIVTM
jgi:hypothetical protein